MRTMPSLVLSVVVAHILATVLREFDSGVRQGILDHERIRAAIDRALLRLRTRGGGPLRRHRAGIPARHRTRTHRGLFPRRRLPARHRRQGEWTGTVIVNPVDLTASETLSPVRAQPMASMSAAGPSAAYASIPGAASSLAPIPGLAPSSTTLVPTQILGTYPPGYCSEHGWTCPQPAGATLTAGPAVEVLPATRLPTPTPTPRPFATLAARRSAPPFYVDTTGGRPSVFNRLRKASYAAARRPGLLPNGVGPALGGTRAANPLPNGNGGDSSSTEDDIIV